MSVPAVQQMTTTIRESIVKAKRCLEAARQRMKAYADQHRRAVDVQVGDKVLLDTRHIRLKHPGSRKLMPKWIGPFTISAQVGKVAFRLELPSYLSIHPVFHASLLKPYWAHGKVQPPPPVELEDELEYEVETVLDHRVRRVGRKRVTQYLCKWTGYGHEHNMWVPEPHMRHARELVEEYHNKNKSTDLAPSVVTRRSERLRSKGNN